MRTSTLVVARSRSTTLFAAALSALAVAACGSTPNGTDGSAARPRPRRAAPPAAAAASEARAGGGVSECVAQKQVPS